MAMNVLQSPSRPGLGKVSGFFWRNPGAGAVFTAAWPANVVWHCLFRLAANAVMAGLLYL